MFKFITKKPLWVNILIGFALAFGLFFLILSSMGWYTGHGDSKTVPSIIGKDLKQAEDILKKAGFDVEVQDSVYIDTLRPLQVVRQVPDEMEVVKSNRTVYLTINRAMPPLIEMPNLVASSLRAAELMLKNNGLKLGDTTFRPDFAINSVLEQLYNGVPIPARTKIRQGSVISLVIGNGLGDKMVGVPNFVGKTYAQAKVIADSLGISFGAIIMYPDIKDTASSFIYKQVPDRFDEEGNMYQIRAGQTIDVWLSAAPPDMPVTPPQKPEKPAINNKTNPAQKNNDTTNKN